MDCSQIGTGFETLQKPFAAREHLVSMRRLTECHIPIAVTTLRFLHQRSSHAGEARDVIESDRQIRILRPVEGGVRLSFCLRISLPGTRPGVFDRLARRSKRATRIVLSRFARRQQTLVGRITSAVGTVEKGRLIYGQTNGVAEP